jgi:hypothetical protein
VPPRRFLPSWTVEDNESSVLRLVHQIGGLFSCLERKNVAIDKKRSRTRSGKDRRRGVDTRTEEEKRLVGERRSTSDRGSGRERRLDAKEEIIRRLERAEIAIRELQHFIATHRN